VGTPASWQSGNAPGGDLGFRHGAAPHPSPHDQGLLRTPTRPALTSILIHVLREYARRAGHLDVGFGLIDGTTGD